MLGLTQVGPISRLLVVILTLVNTSLETPIGYDYVGSGKWETNSGYLYYLEERKKLFTIR